MRYYFAPLEGLTDSIYRRLHHAYFGGVDRYYTPFFSPTVHRALTPRGGPGAASSRRGGFSCDPSVAHQSAGGFSLDDRRLQGFGI